MISIRKIMRKFTRLDLPFFLVFLTIIVGAYFGIIRIQFSYISTARAEQNLYTNQMATNSSLRSQLRHTTRRIFALRQEMRALEERVPQRERLSEFLHGIVAIADASKIRIEQLRPQAPIQGDRHRIVPFVIEAKADFPQLHAFVANLKSMPQYISIDEMALKGIEGSGELQIRLVLYTYYQKG